MKKIGFILTLKNKCAVLIVPYHIYHAKYKKLQIKINKYYIADYREEYKKGDVVFFNTITNKIYKLLD